MVEKENRIEDKGKKTKKRIVPLHAHLITFSKKKKRASGSRTFVWAVIYGPARF
jgi:hypothetical protein